jgi:hypothetical protein
MDRIDYLVNEGAGNVERGKDELVKVSYFQHIHRMMHIFLNNQFEKKRYMKRASRLILTLSLLDIVLVRQSRYMLLSLV